MPPDGMRQSAMERGISLGAFKAKCSSPGMLPSECALRAARESWGPCGRSKGRRTDGLARAHLGGAGFVCEDHRGDVALDF